MNTNTKQFMQKVQKDLIAYYDNGADGLKNTFNVVRQNKTIKTDYAAALHMVQGGTFNCYYTQVAQSMANWFNCSVGDIWTYYKNDEGKLWQSYCHIVAKNLLCIINNTRCYL